MNIHYIRPTHLSDPYHDHGQERLEQLLSRPDDRLTWVDFQTLFDPTLPGGTYEETIYFLPLAFAFLENHRDNDASEVVRCVVGFISIHADKLAADSLLMDSREQILKCLEKWTLTFRVVPHDKHAFHADGWGTEYKYHVGGAACVFEMLRSLHEFKQHADLADVFLTTLVDSRQTSHCAWFLAMTMAYSELAALRKHRSIYRMLLSDTQLSKERLAVVQADRELSSQSPDYWHDVAESWGVA